MDRAAAPRTQPNQVAAAIAAVFMLGASLAPVSCGDAGATRAAAPEPKGLSARELMDASDAIEKFLNAERTREAEVVARKLLEKAPSGSDAESTANELAARAFFARSRLAAAELTPDERASLAAEAATCAERAARSGRRDASRIAFAALLASGAGRRDTARELFDLALETAPGDGRILQQAALDANATGDLERARALAARRREVVRDDAWNDGLDAEIALAGGDPKRAVASAQAAMALDRDSLEFRFLLARALRRDGRSNDAARLLSALDPAEKAKPAIAEQLALALSDAGEFAAAAQAWDASLAANPANAYVRAETARAYLRAGDEARAAAEFARLDQMPGGREQRARIEAEPR